MIAMIVFLIFAISFHSGALLIDMRDQGDSLDEMNWIKWETYFEHSLQYGMVCMAIALMLSVRIWTTYLLKILFLSHQPEDQE